MYMEFLEQAANGWRNNQRIFLAVTIGSLLAIRASEGCSRGAREDRGRSGVNIFLSRGSAHRRTLQLAKIGSYRRRCSSHQ
jgi:hypothetical protein